jgi:hypothetical protein
MHNYGKIEQGKDGQGGLERAADAAAAELPRQMALALAAIRASAGRLWILSFSRRGLAHPPGDPPPADGPPAGSGSWL